MKRTLHDNSGVAMILAIIAVVVILGALVVTSQMVTTARHGTTRTIDMQLVEDACKSGIDFAVERIWNQYVIGQGNTTGNMASYKVFADGLVAPGGHVELLGQPMVLNEETGLQIENIRVARTDTLDGVSMTVRVTGALGELRQSAEQTVLVSGAPFAGFEYAVLANYINCVLCHAGFYSLEERMNADNELYGNFDRVKVATLEALLYRPSAADSVVAGTVYTRGQVYDEAYRPRTPAQITNSDFKNFRFSTDDGKLEQLPDGSMVRDSLRQAGTDAQGRPELFASLYTNYPSDPNLMTDGPLPTEFPAPYPDFNEDRYVDDDEFEEIAQALNGAITGGVAHGVPHGDFYSANALPAASNDALAALSANGRYDGNLILTGTAANPIRIDGEVAVNGDLLIQGVVQGWGQVFVRGNTYITGDVVYNDAPGEFGVAPDGTRNGLALITGGSVLMGDYLTIRGKQHTQDPVKYPNNADSIDVRARTRTRTRTMNNVTETLQYGYFDPGVIDANEIAPTMLNASGNEVPRQGQQFSFTQSELQLFNNLELEKALADPNYRPRFYGLRDTQPDNVYIYTHIQEEHAVRYDEGGNYARVKFLTDRLIELGVDPDSVLDRAAFHYMNPSDNWISEDALRQIWYNDEMQRARGDKWRFDGLLYSNNAIFAITRSYSRHKSHTNGDMFIRGAIICPDLGVLAPGPDQRGRESFTLWYDSRVRDFWAPQNTNRVVFQRMAYRTFSEGYGQ